MAGAAGGADAEQAAVAIAVVERHARLDPRVLVKHIRIQPAIHAFAGPTSGEAAAAAKKGLEGGESVYVRGRDWKGFEGKVDVGEAR